MRRDAPRSRRACAAIERRSKGDRRLCGPQGFKPQLPLWDVVEVGPYRIGVLGLLTSERGIFRKDKMRGLAIEPVGAMAERLAALLRSEHGATHVIALTHQTVGEGVERQERRLRDMRVTRARRDPLRRRRGARQERLRRPDPRWP